MCLSSGITRLLTVLISEVTSDQALLSENFLVLVERSRRDISFLYHVHVGGTRFVPDECQHTIFHTYLTHTVQEQGVNQIMEE